MSAENGPDARLVGGSALDAAQAEVLGLGAGVSIPPVAQELVHRKVTEIARGCPDRVAVRCKGVELDYATLDTWSGAIATRLATMGVGRGSRVAVLAEPSTHGVAAILGALRCRAAYVPLDPGQPDQRITAVLADADVAAIAVSPGAEHRLPATDVPVVRIADVAELDSRVPQDFPEASVDDPAYLIYTSGSSGEPKGVLVEHGQLAASTAARRAVYPDAGVFLLVSPLMFDSSVAGLWGTLTAGGCLVVATPDEVRDPARLVELIAEHAVTRLLCVPSLYRLILDAAERAGSDALKSVESVIVAGEPLPESLAERHFRLHGESAELFNEYGPTEATVWASYERITESAAVSIGRPVPGARLYVLDELQQPLHRGVTGELFIGGAGVARGYFGRPESTARAFLADPFSTAPNARMYRTGDLVRWNEQGRLEFLGRRDHQVKIRGHRVELGAVEEALRAVPGISDAVVVFGSENDRMTGFVLAAQEIEPAAIRAALADRLPDVMIPPRIVRLTEFPLLVSGKVDRSDLTARSDEYVEPRTTGADPGSVAAEPDEMTAKVIAAWAEVLNTTDIPTEVNFFDLGGHSLIMFKLQDALENRTGARPSVVTLFRHTTVAEQVQLIRSGGQDAAESVDDMREAAARRARAIRARRRRAASRQESEVTG